MLNALQGGQVMGEFRGISPAERDRLVQAMGDKLRIEELSWTLNLLVVFNTQKKPFDDVRVRKALLLAIDRWGGSQALARISTLRSVGGVIRPGSPYATPEAELVKLPGFGKDINAARAEAKRLLAEAGRAEPQVHPAQPQPGDALYAGGHLPGRPMAPDRRHRRAQAVRHRALSGHHERRQPRRRDRLLQPVHGRALARARQVRVVQAARPRTARARTTRSSTSSSTRRCASATPTSARS